MIRLIEKGDGKYPVASFGCERVTGLRAQPFFAARLSAEAVGNNPL
jgi:hypothetical protein